MNTEDDARALEDLEQTGASERRPGETAVIGLFLGAGVCFWVGALNLNFDDERFGVGPGAVPLVVSSLFVVVMMIAFIQSLVLRRRRSERRGGVSWAGIKHAAGEFGFSRDLFIVVGVLVLSLLLVPVVGLIPALAAMSFVCSWLVGRKPWWSSLIVAAAAAAVIHVVFDLLLGVPVPQPLSFL